MLVKLRLSKEEITKVLEDNVLNTTQKADALGIGDTTARRWIKYGVPKHAYEDAKVITVPESIEEEISADKVREKYRTEIAILKRKNKELMKQSNIHDRLFEMAQELIPRIKSVKVNPPKIEESHTVEDAILGWADWHGGEIIDSEVMLGANYYNPAIMCRRAQTTVDTTLSLLFDNHRGTNFENLYVFDLGDGVAGDLLADNMATNAMGVFQSILFVAAVKATALAELSAYIPVKYISVPGNHGRRKEKMPWKQPSGSRRSWGEK